MNGKLDVYDVIDYDNLGDSLPIQDWVLYDTKDNPEAEDALWQELYEDFYQGAKQHPRYQEMIDDAQYNLDRRKAVGPRPVGRYEGFKDKAVMAGGTALGGAVGTAMGKSVPGKIGKGVLGGAAGFTVAGVNRAFNRFNKDYNYMLEQAGPERDSGAYDEVFKDMVDAVSSNPKYFIQPEKTASAVYETFEKLASDNPRLAEKVAVIMLEKMAATKVQKMIDAGLISPKSQVQLFKRNAPVDNLNNRINAKAKQMAEQPHKIRHATDYRNAEKINNLPHEAAIDTRRVTRYHGKQNGKVVNDLRKTVGHENVNVKYDKDGFLNGYSELGYNDAKPMSWNINLTSKDLQESEDLKFLFPGVTNKKTLKAMPELAKELRATTARHEISGEAASQLALSKALRDDSYPLNQATNNIFRVGSHISPLVRLQDARMVSQLSEPSKRALNRKTMNGSGFTKDLKDLSELEFTNLLLRGKSDSAKSMLDIKPVDRQTAKRALKDTFHLKFKGGFDNKEEENRILEKMLDVNFKGRSRL